MPPTRQARGITEEMVAVGLDAESIRRDFAQKLYFDLAKFSGVSTLNDHYLALSYAIRDRLLDRWVRSARTFLEGEHRTVIYLSAEYLLGPQLANNLLALGIEPAAREAMDGLGLSLDEIIEHEQEPGLGNGGLGRLAACFMDSLATLDLPAIGHGIRYEFGIFDQLIRDGQQVEITDLWLRLGNPWEIRRWDIAHPVGFGGRTRRVERGEGFRVIWEPSRVVLGVPYDTPVLGYRTENANTLRLWAAVADEEFDLEAFQVGEYWKAVDDKVRSENISKVLYPNDSSRAGKQLRLEQEYFFVACALKDAIRLLQQRTTIDRFAEKFAVQLNDTHPSLAVPELMRLLVDEHDMGWDAAWDITTKAIAYTNHTLMPEALETWPLDLFGELLPRHLEIIEEIDRRFAADLTAKGIAADRIARMALVDRRAGVVRMAHVATVASHAVNGVAALHSRLLRETVLADFVSVWPDRFTNVTNGVTPRRFVALANPGLAGLVTEAVGDGWLTDLESLHDLEPMAEDAAFRQRWREVKTANKERYATWLRDTHALVLDPASLVDVQCKRIHEYKRQHLNLLHVVSLWERIRREGPGAAPARTVVFAGKAAPGYRMAKLVIHLANAVAAAIDADEAVRGHLRVVFAPDFNVKNAQRLYPAADLSEQISTAGLEASGTGNMKLSMNGALTIGTLDGANVEIRDAVGAENFFLFGLTAEEVTARKARGYDPRAEIAASPELARVLARVQALAPDVFGPLVSVLVERDPFLVLADFEAYVAAQRQVEALWADPEEWARRSILNVARMGRFSSDRSIREYASQIWNVSPVKISGAEPAGPVAPRGRAGTRKSPRKPAG